MGEVYVHDDADSEHSGVFFELPADLVDRVYAINPDDTFANNLREILEQADKYESLVV